MATCNKCKTTLKDTPVYKVTSQHRAKIVALNLYCPTRGCNYEREASARKTNTPIPTGA